MNASAFVLWLSGNVISLARSEYAKLGDGLKLGQCHTNETVMFCGYWKLKSAI